MRNNIPRGSVSGANFLTDNQCCLDLSFLEPSRRESPPTPSDSVLDWTSPWGLCRQRVECLFSEELGTELLMGSSDQGLEAAD